MYTTLLLLLVIAIAIALIAGAQGYLHLAAMVNAALGTVVDTDTPALTDNILYIQNSHFLPQQPIYCYAAYAISPTLVRAKLTTPKIRQINPVYIRPIDFGAVVPSANPNMDIKTKSPFLLQQLEEIQVLATAAPATTEVFVALLWLMDTLMTPPALGDVYTVRWTSTVASAAYVWTNIAPGVFEQVLPFGQYTVIDTEYFAANAFAHRYIFDQQYFRPGTLGFANNRSRLPYQFYFGALGNWGTFRTTNLPRQEVLNTVSNASHEGYYHVVKTA